MVKIWLYNQLTLISPLRLIKCHWSLAFIDSIFWYSDMSTDLNARKRGAISCYNLRKT